MKKRAKELSDTEKMKTLDALYTAASVMKGRAAVKAFLRDLLTESERIMLGRRILVARLLIQGESHNAIRARTGVGYATIHRVERWLIDSLPGYEDVIQKMEREYGERAFRAYARNGLARLKKRYPLHFLLFPAPKKS